MSDVRRHLGHTYVCRKEHSGLKESSQLARTTVYLCVCARVCMSMLNVSTQFPCSHWLCVVVTVVYMSTLVISELCASMCVCLTNLPVRAVRCTISICLAQTEKIPHSIFGCVRVCVCLEYAISSL